MLAGVVSRLVGGAVLGFVGWRVGVMTTPFMPWGLVGTLVGLAVGLAVTPFLVVWPVRKTQEVLEGLPGSTLASAIVGLLVGLVVAALISVPLSRIPGWPGVWVPLALSVVLGYLGMAIMVRSGLDVTGLVPEGVVKRERHGARSTHGGQILVDTSAIIDGRIADISQTGFVQGTLVIPRFVLDELRHIADSSDSLRRNRGRRGLEMLNKLRKDSDVPIRVLDTDVRDGNEVDGKLVTLAKKLGAPIVTTDFNLNRVAELQGVLVLNINELANAIKPVVLPGEEMSVRVIQEGKEAGQGVAFLDDGTMVVVEGGRRHINQNIDVLVTRVLQTAAGRIIFSQPKA
ncbi:MAG: PIN domain nuclease [Chloroflexi bacterium]|nr:PIN domain nuclease [Chloroflexota bacterium]